MADKKYFFSSNDFLFLVQWLKGKFDGFVEKAYKTGSESAYKTLSDNDLTDALKTNYDAAYTHSQATHAPSNAERNTIVGITVNGTTITPNSSTRVVAITTPEELPSASASDNGKVLGVVSGSWAKMDAPDGLPSVSGSDNGKVMGVSGGSWGAVSLSIPSDTTDLTNGAGYQTASDVSGAIATAIGGITAMSFHVCGNGEYNSSTHIPTVSTPDGQHIYLVPNGGTGNNVYDEFLYVNNAFEYIGTTAVDLDGYVQIADLESIGNTALQAIINQVFSNNGGSGD